ncbi:hypothetical protein MNB_SV-15-1520 [hydrothermal vent metagenome]|uniref:Uncharacterized protein n=1 Tax=hydrothermal vent metagenome TaxID=652676 RepID=A0A1W1EJX7_9ZZZZ
MFDMSKPIQNEVVIGAIIVLILLVGVGLGVTEWFKKRLGRDE